MKHKIQGIILFLVGIILIIGSIFLLRSDYREYSIPCIIGSMIVLYFSMTFILESKDPEKRYEKEVQSILKTYDSVLVKSNNIPKLKNKTILSIDSIEDLVDAQLEIRKPICYFKQTDSCSFLLMDEETAYIYIKKVKDSISSPIEIEIRDCMLEKKKEEGIDPDILEAIEKTMIIKLANNKSYKISPIRQKKVIEDMEII